MQPQKRRKNSESDFMPYISSSESVDNRTRKKKKKIKKTQIHETREGKWRVEEEQVYVNFLQQNEHLFNSEHDRRSYRVFDQLSKLLNNKRSADQCRSHHHKMWRKAKFSASFEDIIDYICRKYHG